MHQLRGEVWEPFRYLDKGTLGVLGRGRAVADLSGGIHLHGLPAFMTWLLVHIYYLSGFRNKLLVRPTGPTSFSRGSAAPACSCSPMQATTTRPARS